MRDLTRYPITRQEKASAVQEAIALWREHQPALVGGVGEAALVEVLRDLRDEG